MRFSAISALRLERAPAESASLRAGRRRPSRGGPTAMPDHAVSRTWSKRRSAASSRSAPQWSSRPERRTILTFGMTALRSDGSRPRYVHDDLPRHHKNFRKFVRRQPCETSCSCRHHFGRPASPNNKGDGRPLTVGHEDFDRAAAQGHDIRPCPISRRRVRTDGPRRRLTDTRGGIRLRRPRTGGPRPVRLRPAITAIGHDRDRRSRAVGREPAYLVADYACVAAILVLFVVLAFLAAC
jgi:hypothetical protein